MNKVISIHQAETFPYPGYFNKMMNSDEFIILDNVQFKKNNYQNRNRIVHEGKPKWLTFPVEMKGHLSSTMLDMKIADTVDWRSRNIKVIEDAYKDSPYYDIHMPVIKDIINNSDNSLFNFNMMIISYIRHCLSIDTTLIFSSSLNIDSHKSDLVLDICKSRETEVYLSGKGGKGYLDESKFIEDDISIRYQEFREDITYTQDTEEFIPYMSTIDILMNNDNRKAREYISSAFYYTE